MGGLTAADIDWRAPWFAPLEPLRGRIEGPQWRDALTEAAGMLGVLSGRNAPIRFVEPDAAGDTAYEAFIARTGRVPSRDNLHDRFNALMWLVCPRTKAALNARQAAEIERAGIGSERGAVRDAATLIDENAVILQCNDAALLDALATHDWHHALVTQRARWGRDIQAFPFGHALMEKLCRPYKSITACVVPVPLEGDADAAAAAFVQRADLAPALLRPLPVLGIPGWWADNADPRFYADEQVFRPPPR